MEIKKSFKPYIHTLASWEAWTMLESSLSVCQLIVIGYLVCFKVGRTARMRGYKISAFSKMKFRMINISYNYDAAGSKMKQ